MIDNLKVKIIFVIIVLVLPAHIALGEYSKHSTSVPNEFDVYKALKNHVEALKIKKDYKAAIEVLNGFLKGYSHSKYIPYVWVEKGTILIDNFNRIDDGYSYIERAAKSKQDNLSKDVASMQKKYGGMVTSERINKIAFYLEKYFLDEQKFPDDLNELREKFPSLKRRLLYDGFSNKFFYKLMDNSLIEGDDLLYFDLLSYGADLEKNTDDDIYFMERREKKTDITLHNVFMENNLWLAELEYFDKKYKTRVKRKVKQGFRVKEYVIFGINEDGIVLLKGRTPLIIKKD